MTYAIVSSGPLIKYLGIDDAGVPMLTRWRQVATTFEREDMASETLERVRHLYPRDDLHIMSCLDQNTSTSRGHARCSPQRCDFCASPRGCGPIDS